ncbi:MAG: VOC family protein [Leptotrichiaceae bacterium]|nr:VOC family protein [Leptotrichiaceae bacterium]MBP6281577.1 VOC family protein [Leptotrichiaceae bacterium]MBP7101271.1 VOC family protein [Leptotrichiaceae bacterium]MBP7739655.1 VOC family protein [Leptotrichiaceae bacterium]MBP9630419.1 VOC family protein [Leptotrichiaceae bacterium]
MKINHIALYTKNLEKSKEFYEKYFEAIPNKKYYNEKTGLQTYFLSFPGNEIRLEIMTRPELTGREDKVMNAGFIHIAFSVGSKEKVDILTKKIIKDGFECLSGPRTTGDGYYESVIVDLDGNLVEITE